MTDHRTFGLTHIALKVQDIRRTKRFYQQVFGMEVMYEESDFLQLTTPGAHDILVFEKGGGGEIGKTGGIAHFGFRLRSPESIAGFEEEIVKAGGSIIDAGDFLEGAPYIFFNDPDGYEIEIWFEME